ncbi:hypothetical protein A9977_04695 [Variovorax sp. UMC13]|nr:hypothetical protein [Variovorax sp. UMC13]
MRCLAACLQIQRRVDLYLHIVGCELECLHQRHTGLCEASGTHLGIAQVAQQHTIGRRAALCLFEQTHGLGVVCFTAGEQAKPPIARSFECRAHELCVELATFARLIRLAQCVGAHPQGIGR